MRIQIICPAPPGSRSGNRTTAERWARLLRALGHRVAIAEGYDGELCDLLIAMHARRSADAARTFHQQYPHRPLIVALTGTDLYRDLARSHRARESVELATRLVLLQPLGRQALPPQARAKARVVYQSATPVRRPRRTAKSFDVCVIANLRPVKDPLRTALAARHLPASSRVRVLHVGAALSAALARRARAEMQRNRRYRWLGERPHADVRALLGTSRLLVLSSVMEGGANVISEALAASVPVLASRIPGSCGLLGHDYPGLFSVGDTKSLSHLLQRAETDRRFYAGLARACAHRRPLVRPAHERRAWARLLREVTPKRHAPP